MDNARAQPRPEKRGEQRQAAVGVVEVTFSDPAPLKIEGRLVDLSASGFRMAHDCHSLAAGQVVEFRHVAGVGLARVVWNRIVGRRIESGFVVL